MSPLLLFLFLLILWISLSSNSSLVGLIGFLSPSSAFLSKGLPWFCCRLFLKSSKNFCLSLSVGGLLRSS